MGRFTFGFLGLVLALFPERVVESYEELAFENPEECAAKGWIVPGTRAEGLAFAVFSLIGGKGYAWLMNLTGAAGVVALLFPKRYLDFGTELAYERPEAVEWKDGFVDLTRFLGALYVLLAIEAFKRRRGSD